MSDSSKNEIGPKGQMIMGIVFMFGSLMVILVALSSMLGSSKEREAVDWPKVQGVVLESGARKFRESASHAPNWVPHVKYRYQVEGQNHIGENYRFFHITYEGRYKKSAEEMSSKYKPEAPLMVRVNPEDASESVIVALKPRGKGSSYIAFGFSCIGLLVGGALGWSGFKEMRAAV
ncbi:DUF3592 domain-containing protein [bacterium]|nr:DUF3592 domain-containing protein [bacterium]MDB4545009.1 DUF3592 domain-containing protein [bacterium]MDC0294900.1 DUF3592 domain-containing protein [Mariniblastus sp.]